jgi:hypothetical protein
MSQRTAPVRSVEAANGVTNAYRRSGSTGRDAPPLVCFPHSRGNPGCPPPAGGIRRMVGGGCR